MENTTNIVQQNEFGQDPTRTAPQFISHVDKLLGDWKNADVDVEVLEEIVDQDATALRRKKAELEEARERLRLLESEIHLFCFHPHGFWKEW